MRIAIGRIREEQNTALYYERAARSSGHEVTVIHSAEELACGEQFDFFLAVDPWFEGLRFLPLVPCPSAVVLIDLHQELHIRLLFARFFDHVFVAQRDYLERFKADGCVNVHWLPLGADPGVHYVEGLSRDIDVGFVGKLGNPSTERNRILSHVLSRFCTNDMRIHYAPAEMGVVYSRSKIVFNKSIGGDVNMRVFEALAAGALLVTDRISNGLDLLLSEGVHYIGYDTPEEAVAQIERFLSDENGRSSIAQAGQNLLFSRHTYATRLSRIIQVVMASGSARPALARSVLPAQRRLWGAELARRRGLSPRGAAALVAEGLSVAGYLDLAVGLVRGLRRGIRST